MLLDAGVQADQTTDGMHRRRSLNAGARPRMLPDLGAQAAVAEHGEGGRCLRPREDAPEAQRLVACRTHAPSDPPADRDFRFPDNTR